MSLKAILDRARWLAFDFDGTLVDSNPIKWDGFEHVFRDFPDRLAEIMAYCRGSNHTIRGEKFRYVYEHILGLPYSAETERRLHERYASVTTEAVIAAPEIPRANQFLAWAAKTRKTAVISSTPHDILMTILERRGLRGFVKMAQGAPVDKAAWLTSLMREESLTEHELLFFGDTSEDAEAGRLAGCTFIAVRNSNVCGGTAARFIPDFTNTL